jgi:GNAT superfamily N-acetyltransferase
VNGAAHPGEIRIASSEEFPALRRIEHDADEMFASVGIGPFNEEPEDDHLDIAEVVLVYGTPAVGFACVEVIDGLAHLWQLSVLPEHARRGIGSALLQAVCDWAADNGYAAVTLTTFRDVAWNGPFYARHGFRALEDLSPGLREIRTHEQVIGDDRYGPRVAMRKDLDGPTPRRPA